MITGHHSTDARELPADPRTSSLASLVRRQAERTPDAVAITAHDSVLTYAQLAEHAARIAAELGRRGARPGNLIGMAIDRSAAAVAAILGILEAGCAFVPLDPNYPADRLRFMVADCAPSTVIGTEDALPGGYDGDLVDLDELLAEPAGSAGPAEVSGDDPAYVLYTSGSTGRPKGVVIPHRGIVNRILWENTTYPTGPGDAILLRTPLSFDISLWEIFVPLSTGARLVVADPLYRDDPRYLVDLVRDEGVTSIALVPSLLQALLEDEPGLRECTALRDVFCGGEALSPGLVRKFFDTVDAGLHNMYGPTEYSIDATYWDCRVDPVIPIGHPLANTRLYVLDDQGRQVADGEAGELHIAGLGLALGYLNRPELTHERFVPDPFHDGRMYRTGDLVRHRPDGALEFLGRTDDQVKLRGFRVELGEVERAVLATDGVESAAVTTLGEGADTNLVAYVVPAGVTPELVRATVAERLPHYMVPAQVVPLDRFPLGPSGKVNKAALPPPASGHAPVQEGGSAYADSEEATMVAEVFTEVLGVQAVPVDADFFELGGNSLQAVRLINRLRKRVRGGVSLATLIERPTVAGIAAAIREARPA